MKIIFTFFIFISVWLVQAQDVQHWFPFNPNIKEADSNVICMQSWMDKPAGKHGFVGFEDEKLFFEDGTPAKFWGVNISGNNVFTGKKEAELWAETLSDYGVNSVRFHKFTYPGMRETVSTDLKEEKYARMDYFSSKLKEKGIYYGWSPIYGHKPLKGDSLKLLAYHEIFTADLNNHLSYSTIGLVNFAEDLQDLHIELVTNMLNHKNPYTGLRYADDPALINIEIQNEDDIYFSTTEMMLEKCPTYKKLLTEMFADWLINKYKDQDNLKKAWGEKAFEWGKEVRNVNWNLVKRNIIPIANHGIYSYEFTKAKKDNKPLPVFLADMATFLFEQQSKYYQRVVNAIRNTGYKGMIVGSCWQAGSGITHYYNLYADYEVGMIDRHNYFGGGMGFTIKPGIFNNEAMVSSPGYGLLGTGMQQVEDRPFSFSEWLSIIPNEWTAEAAPIIAAYGMGLQGWDASFSYESQTPYFTPTTHIPSNVWPSVYNIMSPTNLVLYPALARMIYRNDVKEGDIVSRRFVDLRDLSKGELRFSEIISQDKDVKGFKGTIPIEALAVGRVVVDFTDKTKKTDTPNLTRFWDVKNKIIRSNTKQLEWNYSEKGYITINTPGTKGVIGFAEGKEIVLGDVSVKINNLFAVVLITSLDKEKSIKDSKHILVTTMARVENTGTEYNTEKTELLKVGRSPILLEPVKVQLSFRGLKIKEAIVLDHIGNRTDVKIKSNESVLLDGTKYKAIYYEIELSK